MYRPLTTKEQRQVDSAIAESPLLSLASESGQYASLFRGIMKHYAMPLRFGAGEIVCRKGDYGNEMYFLVDGALREVVSDPEGAMPVGAPPGVIPAKRGRYIWPFRKRIDEDIPVVDVRFRQRVDNVSDILRRCKTIQHSAGSAADSSAQTRNEVGLRSNETILGMYPVLTGTDFGRTVFAETQVRLLALHRRGMRELATLFEGVQRAVNERCLAEIAGLVKSQSIDMPIFSKLSEDALTRLLNMADFRTFYRPADENSEESIAIRQGSAVREVLILLSGFGRVRRATASRIRSVGFLRRGDVFGLAALAAQGRGASTGTELDLLGDTSLLTLPADPVVEHCLPVLSRLDIVSMDPAADVEFVRSLPFSPTAVHERSREASLVDFLVEKAFIRGRRAMVIDQGHCVGCDACVRACADTHGGVPRFVRAGPVVEGRVIANACMHCEEAPCLVNCPTQAIFRKRGGEVVVSEALCVGCGTCAVACPFDNIRLVEQGADSDQKESSTPIAIKCDLCIGRKEAPACVSACPHDAIARIDLSNHDVVTQLASGAPLDRVSSID